MLSAIRQVSFAAAAQRRAFTMSSGALSRWTDLVKRTQESLKIDEINVDQLDAELATGKNVVLIDVRETAECEQNGKIPGAINLGRGVLELGIEKVVAPEAKEQVVLYCAGGLRSIMAAESLIRMGYQKDSIKSLKGGFAAWKKAGYDVENK
ncbi:Rhodanese-like domain-containing protein [Dichotomocladium elegans]|nr:Rhodanese-like domain-containing protein [Dichotomocladium elegans]